MEKAKNELIFKNFNPRLYQEKIFYTSLNNNSLVVLPTGLGKTAVAMMLAVARLKKYPDSKILFLAPTRPLVNQHYESFTSTIDNSFLHPDEFVAFTGAINAKKRAELWQDSKIIFSTPQGLENDIVSKRIDLSTVSLIIFDEAHRATGDYSYVWIADRYRKQAKFERILALTASPGTDQETIDEVCNNLFIDKIEYRDRESSDVKPYIKQTKFTWVEVDLPESFKEVLKILKEIYSEYLKNIKNILGKINKKPEYINKKDILAIQAQLQGNLARGESSLETYKAISDTASLLKIQHAIELLETQGIRAVLLYLEDLWNQGKNKKTKAATKLVSDFRFRKALTLLWKIRDAGIEHPKLKKLKQIVAEYLVKNSDAKIIIFNNYRDSISMLKDALQEIDIKNKKDERLIRPEIFVGQAKKKGMGITQKTQLKRIQEFREGIHNVMLMSSVGEEGLDIPAVDLVLFYEPVPSAIRQIQRAGRTGRQEKGEVIVLIANNTRDVAYRWSTQAKQKKMYQVLDKSNSLLIKDEPKEKEVQKDLKDNFEKAKTIIVDSREKSNRIVKQMIDLGYDIKVEQLFVADYILSKETGVEFKTKQDFVDSIIDGRIFEQAATLSRNFIKPLFLIQGEEDIYSLRNIHPNAILGAITSISISFRIPIIFTNNVQETCNIFSSILKRQEKDIKDFSMHLNKPKDENKMKEYVVESLPSVGPLLAKNLLKNFKTIKNIANSNPEELTKVDNLGEIKAKQIYELFNTEYKED